MMHYTIGVNQPGCLPDAEPCTVSDFETAKEVLISELDLTIDTLDPVNDDDDESEDMIRELTEAKYRVRNLKPGDHSFTIGDWCYWISSH